MGRSPFSETFSQAKRVAKKGTVPFFLGTSALVHGLLVVVLLTWASTAVEHAGPGAVRVLLLADDGTNGFGGPQNAAAGDSNEAGKPEAKKTEKAAPVSVNKALLPGTHMKPAPFVPRVRLLETAETKRSGVLDAAPQAVTEGTGGEHRVARRAPGGDLEGPGAHVGGSAARDRRIAVIQARIQRALFYPRKARRRGIEGTAHVRFDILRDGRVDGLAVQRSSGHAMLDRASVKTIERAQPFPFVAGALEVPVVFRLR